MKRAFQFKSKIDNLISISKGLSDDELKSNFSRYLCILASGYLEIAFKELLTNYASLASSPTIQNFIESSIQNITNLKTDRIFDNLCKFNPDWGHAFESRISDEQKAAIDTIVANRNNIAHGGDVGISFVNIKQYYERAQEVVCLLNSIVK